MSARLVFAAAVALATLPAAAERAVPPSRVALDMSADAVVRANIAAAYGVGGRSPAVTVVDRTAADVRRLVGARVDAGLLKEAIAFHGADYRFAAADGGQRQLGVLRIAFATPALAAARARPLQGGDRFLHGAKILTPMAAAAAGPAVIVVFSEHAGDPQMRPLLAAVAEGVRAR